MPQDDQQLHRSYRRGTIMGLTVAESFILLAFCLLLLFTWWQTDSLKKTRDALAKLKEQTDALASCEKFRADNLNLSKEQQELVNAGLADGSFEAARQLREAGFVFSDPAAIRDAAEYSRFIRPKEDLKKLMHAAAKLSPDTILGLKNAVEIRDEDELRAMLSQAPPESPEKTKTKQIAERIEVAARAQRELVQVLNQKLGPIIRAVGGKIDESGTIVLPQAVLFDRDKDNIKNPAFLRQICAPWLEKLRENPNISELKIEGHASSEGVFGFSADRSFLYNLGLSQRRAQNALTICLATMRDKSAQEWARQHLAAIGYSSTRPVLNADGRENFDESRRVMLSFTLNQDRLIEDIKDISKGTPRTATPAKMEGMYIK